MTNLAFKNVMEEILEVPRGSLKDSDTRDTIATWSSLADVKIMTTISSEFGLEPDAELLEAESVGDLLLILESRGVLAG